MLFNFNNATQAFEHLYYEIINNGEITKTTKQIRNCCLILNLPKNFHINTPWRKWKREYAELEYHWYLTKNRNPDIVANEAKIWNEIRNPDGTVNSNYGFLWNQNDQLNKVIKILQKDQESRRAVITLYDGKLIGTYNKDTVCTLNIIFQIEKIKNSKYGILHMSVLMRSNDLIYGFCNDQFCFAHLMQLVASRLNCHIGTYFHYAANMHIYKKHWRMHERI